MSTASACGLDPEAVHGYDGPTTDGNVTLTEGVDELIRGEWEFEAMYDSSASN